MQRSHPGFVRLQRAHSEAVEIERCRWATGARGFAETVRGMAIAGRVCALS